MDADRVFGIETTTTCSGSVLILAFLNHVGERLVSKYRVPSSKVVSQYTFSGEGNRACGG